MNKIALIGLFLGFVALVCAQSPLGAGPSVPSGGSPSGTGPSWNTPSYNPSYIVTPTYNGPVAVIATPVGLIVGLVAAGLVVVRPANPPKLSKPIFVLPQASPSLFICLPKPSPSSRSCTFVGYLHCSLLCFGSL